MSSLFFRLPEEPKPVVTLVTYMPANWCLSADLWAPQERIISNEVPKEEVNFVLNSESWSVSLMEQIASKLFRRYSGCLKLSLYPGQAEVIAGCDIRLEMWTGDDDGRGSRLRPPRIKVFWETQFGGRQEDINWLLGFCTRIGLKAYNPVELDLVEEAAGLATGR